MTQRERSISTGAARQDTRGLRSEANLSIDLDVKKLKCMTMMASAMAQSRLASTMVAHKQHRRCPARLAAFFTSSPRDPT